MDPLTKYGTADLFMSFVARMEMYGRNEIEEIRDYLLDEYRKVTTFNDPDLAIKDCVREFLIGLVEAINRESGVGDPPI